MSSKARLQRWWLQTGSRVGSARPPPPRLLAAVFTISIPRPELLGSRVSLKRPGTDSCLHQPSVACVIGNRNFDLCLCLSAPSAIWGRAGSLSGEQDGAGTLTALRSYWITMGSETLTCALRLCPLSSAFNCGFSFLCIRSQESF